MPRKQKLSLLQIGVFYSYFMSFKSVPKAFVFDQDKKKPWRYSATATKRKIFDELYSWEPVLRMDSFFTECGKKNGWSSSWVWEKLQFSFMRSTEKREESHGKRSWEMTSQELLTYKKHGFPADMDVDTPLVHARGHAGTRVTGGHIFAQRAAMLKMNWKLIDIAIESCGHAINPYSNSKWFKEGG